jgi:hypothetical protein
MTQGPLEHDFSRPQCITPMDKEYLGSKAERLPAVDQLSFLPPDIAKPGVGGYDSFQPFDITDIIVR